MKNKITKFEKERFWLGVFLIFGGMVMLFISLFLEPVGHISNSVLGAFGEISLLSGCLLGCDVYVEYKINKFFHSHHIEEIENIENEDITETDVDQMG